MLSPPASRPNKIMAELFAKDGGTCGVPEARNIIF